MATTLSTLFKSIPAWLTREGDMSDVVLATLGRLVRNLPGQRFPGWSTTASRRSVVETLLPVILSLPGFKTAFHADMEELDLKQRRLLLERKLITPCMAARQGGCQLIIPRKQDVSIMLNEEEHLVMHFYRQGLRLHNVLTEMQHMADSLEKSIRFAKDDENGYLTSLPAEAGDGMQLYVVLHLPALTVADAMEPITRGLEKLEANIAPLYTGLNEDTGNTYVLFTNAISNGEAEQTCKLFDETIQVLIRREIQMRAKLVADSAIELSDRVGRAFGRLCYAMKLSFRELLDDLSMLRLGQQCGLFRWSVKPSVAMNNLISLNLELAPTHLSRHIQDNVPSDFLPVLRALQFKQALMEAGPVLNPPYANL